MKYEVGEAFDVEFKSVFLFLSVAYIFHLA